MIGGEEGNRAEEGCGGWSGWGGGGGRREERK